MTPELYNMIHERLELLLKRMDVGTEYEVDDRAWNVTNVKFWSDHARLHKPIIEKNAEQFWKNYVMHISNEIWKQLR